MLGTPEGVLVGVGYGGTYIFKVIRSPPQHLDEVPGCGGGKKLPSSSKDPSYEHGSAAFWAKLAATLKSNKPSRGPLSLHINVTDWKG